MVVWTALASPWPLDVPGGHLCHRFCRGASVSYCADPHRLCIDSGNSSTLESTHPQLDGPFRFDFADPDCNTVRLEKLTRRPLCKILCLLLAGSAHLYSVYYVVLFGHRTGAGAILWAQGKGFCHLAGLRKSRSRFGGNAVGHRQGPSEGGSLSGDLATSFWPHEQPRPEPSGDLSWIASYRVHGLEHGLAGTIDKVANSRESYSQSLCFGYRHRWSSSTGRFGIKNWHVGHHVGAWPWSSNTTWVRADPGRWVPRTDFEVSIGSACRQRRLHHGVLRIEYLSERIR